jgi:hypothetical protein
MIDDFTGDDDDDDGSEEDDEEEKDEDEESNVSESVESTTTRFGRFISPLAFSKISETLGFYCVPFFTPNFKTELQSGAIKGKTGNFFPLLSSHSVH